MRLTKLALSVWKGVIEPKHNNDHKALKKNPNLLSYIKKTYNLY